MVGRPFLFKANNTRDAYTQHSRAPDSKKVIQVRPKHLKCTHTSLHFSHALPKITSLKSETEKIIM